MYSRTDIVQIRLAEARPSVGTIAAGQIQETAVELAWSSAVGGLDVVKLAVHIVEEEQTVGAARMTEDSVEEEQQPVGAVRTTEDSVEEMVSTLPYFCVARLRLVVH